MTSTEFRTRLVRPEGVGTWTFAPVPATVAARAGFRPRQRVRGRIDGVPISSPLLPMGAGRVFLVVRQSLRERIGKKNGDRVVIELQLATSPAKVSVGPALRRAFKGAPSASAAFNRLASSHRKAYAEWVDGARRSETRVRRAARAVELLRAGRTLK